MIKDKIEEVNRALSELEDECEQHVEARAIKNLIFYAKRDLRLIGNLVGLTSSEKI